MGKFTEFINNVLEIFNSSPFLSSVFWILLSVFMLSTAIKCIFRIVSDDCSYNIVDFIKDTYYFLKEYFSFKYNVRKLMKHKLTCEELNGFFSFENEAKIRFKDHDFITVKDCFNIIFEKDYQIAFHKCSVLKSSKYIIKLLNRYYNLALCERLNYDLLFLYDLTKDQKELVLHSFFHIDSLLNGYSGIPLGDYEKK